MRSSLQTRKRCYNHPHRETELACERCKTSFCQDCLTVDADGRLCANCRRELEEYRAAQLTPRERFVEWLHSLGRGLVIAAVLGLVLVGVFLFYRDNFDRPLTPEELARFRYAMTGSFATEEGINVTSTVVGGRLLSATSEDPSHPAKGLINEFTGAAAPAWRTTTATFPQEVVVELEQSSGPALVSKVIFTQSPEEPVETYARSVELLVSLEGPDRGFVSAGAFELTQAPDAQKFTFTPTRAAYLMLRVLSNHGSTAYTSLDEFNVFVVPNDPMAGPMGGPGTPSPGGE